MSMNPEFKRFRECQYCKELIPINENNEDLVSHDCALSEEEYREKEQLAIEEFKQASSEQEILEKAKDLGDQKKYQVLLQRTVEELIKEDIEKWGKPKLSMVEYRKLAQRELRREALREATRKIQHPEMELYVRTLQSFLKDYDDKLGGILDKSGKPWFSCPVSPCNFSSNDSKQVWEHFILKHPEEAGKYRRADLLLREGKLEAYKYYRKYPRAEGKYPPMYRVSPREGCPVGYQKVKIKDEYHCVEEKYFAEKKEKLSAMSEEESKKFSNDIIILTALTKKKEE